MNDFSKMKLILFEELFNALPDDSNISKAKICRNSCPKSTVSFIDFPKNSFVEVSSGSIEKNLDDTRTLKISNVYLDKKMKLVFLKPPFNVAFLQKVEQLPKVLLIEWFGFIKLVMPIVMLLIVLLFLPKLLFKLISAKKNPNPTNKVLVNGGGIKSETSSETKGGNTVAETSSETKGDNTVAETSSETNNIGSYGNNNNIGTATGKVENQNNYQSPNLAEAAAEIQQLLQQLSQTHPTTTTKEKMDVAAEAIDRIENNHDWKQRVINAAKNGGLSGMKKGIEKATDSIIASTMTGIIEGWLE